MHIVGEEEGATFREPFAVRTYMALVPSLDPSPGILLVLLLPALCLSYFPRSYVPSHCHRATAIC